MTKPSRSILKARIRVLEAENARLRRWEDRPGYTGPDGKVYTDEATVAGATKVKHKMLGRGGRPMTRTTYKRRPGRARRIETALETALGTAGRRATLAIRHARWQCITVYPITVRVVFWTAFAAVLAGIVVATIVVDERWYLAAILLAAPVIIGHSVWMDYYLATRCRCDKCEGVRR